MKTLLLIFVFIAFNCNTKTQTNSRFKCQSYFDEPLKMEVYTIVDTPPTFPGGDFALMRFLMQIKYCSQAHPQSLVRLSFVVDPYGKLLDIGIRDKERGEYSCLDKEVIRIFETSPKWVAGSCNGIKVPVRVLHPIRVSPNQ